MAVTEADVRHFLGRVGFAPTEAEVAHFAAREIDDIVNEVLSVSPALPAKPAWLGVDDDWLANEKNAEWWLNRMAKSSWVDRTATTPSPLIEKLSLFWHSHFASGFQKVEDATLLYEQNQFFRAAALGDFEQMCQAVCIHGAMLIYLDNESNVAGAVQENFARELMELFTMGIGHYTETDVVEMARAWTGHGTVGWINAEDRYDGTYEFHPDDHDEGNKTIFGLTANWNGPETITEICKGSRQQETANFLATKLWRYLVNTRPNASTIGQVASTYVASGNDLGELVRAILTTAEFWDPANRRSLVKSPAHYVVDFRRCTGLTFSGESAGWSMRPMGQELFEPPNVAGWGANGYWLSTATMWGRAEYATNLRWTLTSDTTYLDELVDMTAAEATDHLLRTFRIANPSAATRSAIETWYTRTKVDNEWALPPAGISVTALCPEFQVA